jgi:aryl-alcohol dehydrogenase-like predicted oxidoreductase
MRTHRLGSQGPEISVIGFGAWEAGGDMWGPNESEDEVIGAIRAGLDAGITWIDTAEVYGKGTSEELVGRAVEGRRDELVIATKVAPKPAGTGFRPEEVHRACEQSLKRLGTDRIDIYQLHWPSRDDVPLEDTWGAMKELADEGLVRCTGLSNFDQSQIETCERIRHVDSLQQEFSMLNLDDRDLIRWCGEQGTGVLAYGPLGFGLLTGAITASNPPKDWRARDGDVKKLFGPGNIERSIAVAEALRPVAERLGVTTAQVALAWVVHQPGVTAAIAGSRNPEHVRQNAGAGDIRLDDDTLQELEGILRLGPAFAESG